MCVALYAENTKLSSNLPEFTSSSNPTLLIKWKYLNPSKLAKRDDRSAHLFSNFASRPGRTVKPNIVLKYQKMSEKIYETNILMINQKQTFKYIHLHLRLVATYRSLFNNSPSVSLVAEDSETTSTLFDAVVEKSCVAARVLPTEIGANE